MEPEPEENTGNGQAKTIQEERKEITPEDSYYRSKLRDGDDENDRDQV